MATAQLKCTECGEGLIVHPARKGFTAIITAAYDEGWKRRDGEWFCGSDCITSANALADPLRKIST